MGHNDLNLLTDLIIPVKTLIKKNQNKLGISSWMYEVAQPIVFPDECYNLKSFAYKENTNFLNLLLK